MAIFAIPFALRLIPLVGKGVGRVIGHRNPLLLRCVVAVCVAVTMESIIAFTVTVAQQGFVTGWPLLWLGTLLKALSMGPLIGFSMTFVVHPYLQRLDTRAMA